MSPIIGVVARQCIEKARGHVAAMIGAKDSGMFDHRFINPRYLGFINLWFDCVIYNNALAY